MKKIILTTLLIFAALTTDLLAQRNEFQVDSNGHTLNIGVGIGGYSGYYGYIGHTLPVLSVNYELSVLHNFTLAPFVTLYSYSDANYRSTVVPIGVKGTYYLDQLLRAGVNWDFYAAGSLGISLVNTSWKSNYTGDRTYYSSTDPLYLDFHLGSEYHISRKIGVFLDLSTGVSTIGIAIH